MVELVHVTARIEAGTRDGLKEIAKRRMMATGEIVTTADLIRAGLAEFVERELSGAVAPPPVAVQPEIDAAEDPAPADEEQLDIFDLSPEVPKKRSSKRDELLPEVLRLHGEGKSQGEIAKTLGVDQGTVSRWLAKAKKDGLID
ncbi:sigma-70 family RNA polymerase sigma factor [Azotobacter chroococcum]|uniref:sigma factor-like helix-turn-helix DNA-binding protein n=1 Tax=Azotobacter chroococcum TaxID=353 RepID=UPI00103E14DE|nr:helix-turn-helix domain-containing protein [Azotobacter chroococcum]TBW04263.1 sigma-70 family RNA polymerase sigma factor [Azotobacter chroococcum]